MPSLYLDTSAVVKIAKREPESEALESYLHSRGLGADTSFRMVSSEILRTELMAAMVRDGQPAARAIDVLSRFTLIPPSSFLLDAAGRLAGERNIRSLDGLHLASALSVIDKVSSFVCYDRALAEAAKAAGFLVSSPGLD